VSVGQRVTVFGTVTNPAAGELVLDAANGYARMELSSLQGTRVALVAIPVGISEQPLSFVVDVTSINGRNASLYDFAGSARSRYATDRPVSGSMISRSKAPG